jgi:hypothetical protein
MFSVPMRSENPKTRFTGCLRPKKCFLAGGKKTSCFRTLTPGTENTWFAAGGAKKIFFSPLLLFGIFSVLVGPRLGFVYHFLSAVAYYQPSL